MIETLEYPLQQRTRVFLMADIPFALRYFWSEQAVRQLRLSLLRPQIKPGTGAQRMPTLVWLCGGSWSQMDHNIWLPELVWLARLGVVVVSAEYRTGAQVDFKEQMDDVRACIDFLRREGSTFSIDGENIFLCGESAGAYLAAATCFEQAALGKKLPVICFYPPCNVPELAKNSCEALKKALPREIGSYPDLRSLLPAGGLPPALLLHGTRDELVPAVHSRMLYEALAQRGADPQLCLIRDAGHGEAAFQQDEVRSRIADFIKKWGMT